MLNAGFSGLTIFVGCWRFEPRPSACTKTRIANKNAQGEEEKKGCKDAKRLQQHTHSLAH